MKYRSYFYLHLSTYLNTHTLHAAVIDVGRNISNIRWLLYIVGCFHTFKFWRSCLSGGFLKLFHPTPLGLLHILTNPHFPQFLQLLNGFCWFWCCTHFDMQDLTSIKNQKKRGFSIATTFSWQVSLFFPFLPFILSFPNKKKIWKRENMQRKGLPGRKWGYE